MNQYFVKVISQSTGEVLTQTEPGSKKQAMIDFEDLSMTHYTEDVQVLCTNEYLAQFNESYMIVHN